MWLTSNRPTALRTAWCSSMMPEYWTGMSQPPKSTILAPDGAMHRIQRRLLQRDRCSLIYFAAAMDLTVMVLPFSVPVTLTFFAANFAGAVWSLNL